MRYKLVRFSLRTYFTLLNILSTCVSMIVMLYLKCWKKATLMRVLWHCQRHGEDLKITVIFYFIYIICNIILGKMQLIGLVNCKLYTKKAPERLFAMAKMKGFEPLMDLVNPYTISNRAPSAARPHLHPHGYYSRLSGVFE